MQLCHCYDIRNYRYHIYKSFFLCICDQHLRTARPIWLIYFFFLFVIALDKVCLKENYWKIVGMKTNLLIYYCNKYNKITGGRGWSECDCEICKTPPTV